MNNADYAEHLRSIASLHMKLLPEAGESRTLCGVTLHRRDESNCAATCSAHPGMGLLVQGAKRALMGGKTVEYTAGECLVVGVDMLDSFQAIGATHETPFLGVSFDLEEDEVVKITSEMDACGIPIPKRADAEDLSGAAWIMQPDIKVIDAYAKLVELFETPEEAPILAPLIRREIIFRFLVSQGGAAFRQIFTVGAPEYRIRKAAFEIRKNLRNSIDFRELAKSDTLRTSGSSDRLRIWIRISRAVLARLPKPVRSQPARRLRAVPERRGVLAQECRERQLA